MQDVAVASCGAAALLLFAIVRMSVSGRTARRFAWRGEPAWWPEFERAPDYIRAGDGRRS